MRAIGDFTPINQPETDVFAFDFTSVLVGSETVSSIIEWEIGVETGSDPAAASRAVGPAQLLTGNIVAQAIGNLVAGVVYWFSVLVLTSNNRRLLLWAACDCGVIGC